MSQKVVSRGVAAVFYRALFLALSVCGGMLWAGQSPSRPVPLDSISESITEAPRVQESGVRHGEPPATRLGARDRRQQYAALFFDEYHLSTSDLQLVREAVDHYVAKRLSLGGRVGLFSASGEIGIEFTDDHLKITRALTKLRAKTRFQRGGYCPDITPYHAQRILEESDPEAVHLGVALTFLCRCRCPTSVDTALSTAMLISIHSDIASGNTLKSLDEAVSRMEGLPGSRTLTIVSEGFLRGTHQEEVKALVDRAVRQAISISAFDPKGACALVLNGNPENPNHSLTAQDAAAAKEIVRRSHEADAEVLRELVAATGGTFVDGTSDYDLPDRLDTQTQSGHQ